MGGRGDDRWTSDKTFQYGRAGNQYNTINAREAKGGIGYYRLCTGQGNTALNVRAGRLDARQKQYKRHSAEVRGEARTDRM